MDGPVPPFVMEMFIPGAVENPQGVFKNLIDLHRCDTLEALAAELDIPCETMLQSVARYNQLCAQGCDTDFGKPAKYLHPIVQPSFWGARKHIRVSACVSGVRINEFAQALGADGNPIAGLYCAGNLGGPFFGGSDYPFHQMCMPAPDRAFARQMLYIRHDRSQTCTRRSGRFGLIRCTTDKTKQRPIAGRCFCIRHYFASVRIAS